MGGSQSTAGNGSRSSSKLQRRRRDSLEPARSSFGGTGSSLRKRMGSLLGGEATKTHTNRQQVASKISETQKLSDGGGRLQAAAYAKLEKEMLAPVPVGGRSSTGNNYVSMAARGSLWEGSPGNGLLDNATTRKPLHQLPDRQQQYCSPKQLVGKPLVETSLDKALGSAQTPVSWLMGELANESSTALANTCCGAAANSNSPAFQLGSKPVNSKSGSVLNNSHGVANGSTLNPQQNSAPAAARQPGACLSASLHLSTPLNQRHFYQPSPPPNIHHHHHHQQQQQHQHQQLHQVHQLPHRQHPHIQHQQQAVGDENGALLYASPTQYNTEAQVEATNTVPITTDFGRCYPSAGVVQSAYPGNQHQLLDSHHYADSHLSLADGGVQQLQQQQQQQQQYSWYSRTLEAPGRRAKKKSPPSRQQYSKPSVQSLFSNIDSLQDNNNNNNTQITRNTRGHTVHLVSSANNNNRQLLTSGAKLHQRPISSSGSLKRLKSGPLKARQASYEAMRTIDMYLIRQVAHTCMDYELEQKIDLEIRLRELAAQSMLEARTELDVLEVEKSLLASDQRMNCYALQLEQQRKQLSNPSLSTDSGRGSKTASNKRPTSANRRPDVIGACQAGSNEPTGGSSAGSPSFSAGESVSPNPHSPSKLSPVSGESANSPASFVSSRGSRGSRWRTGQRGRSSSRSSSDHLSAEQKARHKRRQQLLQNIASQSNINCNMVIQSKASVSLSELRIPLMWRDVDHFKQRGDYKRYAVFCLLRIGSQIYDTQLISDVDRQVTDVTFDDIVVFNDVDSEFELTLEVYSCVYLEQFSFGSTPRKLKEKLTSSVSRAMGRRLATQTASTNYTKELEAYQDKSYRFAMIASALLKLEHASQTVKTYDLVLVSPGAHNRQHLGTGSPLIDSLLASRHHNVTSLTAARKDAQRNTLPLFGHFCCRLAVMPDVFDKNIRSGYLRLATISMPNHNHHHPLPSSETTLGSSGLSSSNSPQNSSSDSPSSTMEANMGGDDLNQQRNHHHFNSAESLASKLKASKMASMSMSSSQLYWAVLRNFTLQLWAVDERKLQSALSRNQLPMLPEQPLSFNIDKRTRLLRVSNSSITFETDNVCIVMATYSLMCHQHQHSSPSSSAPQVTSEETGLWLRCLEQYIYDSHIWDNVLSRQQHQRL